MAHDKTDIYLLPIFNINTEKLHHNSPVQPPQQCDEKMKTTITILGLALLIILTMPGLSSSVAENPTNWEDNFTDETGISHKENITVANGDVKLQNIPWWDYNWTYREPINISNTAGNQTDYQVKIELNSSNVGLNWNWTNDGNDARFTYYNTTSGTKTETDYWIESWDSTANTSIIWVKVPFLENNTDTTIYMYYGNLLASSASNITNTFEFFDDFPGNSLDTSKWDTSGGVSVADSKLTLSSSVSEWVKSKQNFASGNYRVDVRITSHNTYVRFRMGFFNNRYKFDDGGPVWWAFEVDGSKVDIWGYNVPANGLVGVTSLIVNEKTRLEAPTNSHEISQYSTNLNGVYLQTWECTLKIDWVLVRKYASPEPTATMGAEEKVTRGELTSVAITPPSLLNWDKFNANNTIPSGTSITYTILNASNNAVLCPVLTGNSDDISTCAGTTPSIKLYAELETSDPGKTPALHSWNVSWIVSGPAANGTIKGTVNDPLGAALAGVKITASDGINNYENSTNSLGEYIIHNINSSTYTVTASKSGYTPKSAPNVLVNTSETTITNFILHPIPTSEGASAVVHFEKEEGEEENRYLPIGSTTRIVIVISNPSDTQATIPLHIGSPDETFRNLVRFENSNIDPNDWDITLGPHGKRYVAVEILAGKIGSHELVIGPDDIYENKYDSIRVVIVNQDTGLFTQSPGLKSAGLIIILALAVILIFKRTSGSKAKNHPAKRNTKRH